MPATYSIFQSALNQFGKQITDEMKKTLQRNNNDNTGRLSNSIQSTVQGDKLIISMEKYGQYVNDGNERRSGRKPPINAIKAWVAKNGISPRGGITAKQLPYVIQAGIAKRGQRQRRKFPFIQPSIDKVLKQDMDNVFGAAIAKEIENMFTTTK